MGLQNFRHLHVGPFMSPFASDFTICDGTSEDEKNRIPLTVIRFFLLHGMFKNTLRIVCGGTDVCRLFRVTACLRPPLRDAPN